MTKWKVYLSSTFRDLKEVRAELIQLFQKQLSNQFELTEIMEWMYDKGTYARFEKECIKAVNDSDIYIIILGNKVGSFPDPETRTYTEIELDTALHTPGKKIFCLRLETFDEQEIDNKAKHRELLNKFAGRPVHTFKDTESLKNRMYECLFPLASQSPINTSNPYKGLAAFEVKDGDYFYGRGAEIESFIKEITVQEQRYISVIGNSGVGKTSFIQAGVLYKLQNEPVWGFSQYQRIIITPGSTPFANFQYQLRGKEISLEQLADENAPSGNFILFFNQFEEIITQCTTPEAIREREQLFDFLSKLTSSPKSVQRLLIITTFRSDFLSQLANFDFIKKQKFFPLSSLDYTLNVADWEKSMAEIITKPAEKNGVTVEPELVAQLTHELKEVEGSLSILQFSLEKIWNDNNVKDGKITSAEYIDLAEGKGMGGIIEAHAEEVIKRIIHADKEKEAILKSIFVNLVEVNATRQDVKRTIKKSELVKKLEVYPTDKVGSIFEELVSEKSRLLIVTSSKDKSTTLSEAEAHVDIIHEVLIRKWERLKGWIDERRKALEDQKQLRSDIENWKRGEGEYYSGKKLTRASIWKSNNPDLADTSITRFIAESKRRYHRRIGFMASIPVVLLLIVLISYTPYQRYQFKKDINKSPSLKAQVEAAGGIDSLRMLKVTEENYEIVKDNLFHFSHLDTLEISDMAKIQDLSLLQGISSLTSLVISVNLNRLSDLEKLTSLKELTIEGNDSLSSLSGLEKLSSLTSLTISGTAISSLSGLEKLSSLTSLVIFDTSISGLSGLEKLSSLTSLTISGTAISSLSGLEKLSLLTSLTIDINTPEVINKLYQLPKLKKLTVSENMTVQFQGLQEKNPGAKLIRVNN